MFNVNMPLAIMYVIPGLRQRWIPNIREHSYLYDYNFKRRIKGKFTRTLF